MSEIKQQNPNALTHMSYKEAKQGFRENSLGNRIEVINVREEGAWEMGKEGPANILENILDSAGSIMALWWWVWYTISVCLKYKCQTIVNHVTSIIITKGFCFFAYLLGDGYVAAIIIKRQSVTLAAATPMYDILSYFQSHLFS